MSEEIEEKRYRPREKTPEQALLRLMDLAARAERSSGDVTRLLYHWGVAPEKHQEILKTLIEQRFIDDERYAVAYVRDKVNFSKWGVYKIRQGLKSKGISDDIARRALTALDREDQADRLRKLLEKRAEKYDLQEERYKSKAKLVRYGVGAGYEYDAVIEQVERLCGGIED